MIIPQGYKQTELGIIPEDWEGKSFSQIFDMYPNNTYPRDCMNDSRGVVRNIHYGDVLIKYPTIVDVENCAIPYLNEDVKIKVNTASFPFITATKLPPKPITASKLVTLPSFHSISTTYPPRATRPLTLPSAHLSGTDGSTWRVPS